MPLVRVYDIRDHILASLTHHISALIYFKSLYSETCQLNLGINFCLRNRQMFILYRLNWDFLHWDFVSTSVWFIQDFSLYRVRFTQVSLYREKIFWGLFIYLFLKLYCMIIFRYVFYIYRYAYIYISVYQCIKWQQQIYQDYWKVMKYKQQ
jgi:hypothetical protein